MKRLLLLLTVAMTTTLAACGGGGSSGNGGGGVIPTPPAPTATPASFALFIHFSGGTAGGAPLTSDKRPATTLTSDTVSLAAPDAPTPNPAGPGYTQIATSASTAWNVGEVQAVMSPLPSPAPSPVSFTTTSSVLQISPTPTPAPSATPVSLYPSVRVGVLTPNATESKTVVVTVGAQSTFATENVYLTAAMTCSPSSGLQPLPAENHSGLSFDSTGMWQPQTTIGASDIYLTGPQCQGAFHTSSGNLTIHFPYGAVVLTGTAFESLLTASSWTNATTSVDATTNGTSAIAFKTADGRIGKFRQGVTNFSVTAGMAVEVAIAGQSPDGFH